MTVEELYLQGFTHRCEGRYHDARRAFAELLARDPQHADSHWQMGLIQGFEGDFDASLITLQGIVDKHPQHVHARYDLAMTLTMLGMQEEACEQFRAILHIDPNHENAKRQLVYC